MKGIKQLIKKVVGFTMTHYYSVMFGVFGTSMICLIALLVIVFLHS